MKIPKSVERKYRLVIPYDLYIPRSVCIFDGWARLFFIDIDETYKTETTEESRRFRYRMDFEQVVEYGKANQLTLQPALEEALRKIHNEHVKAWKDSLTQPEKSENG